MKSLNVLILLILVIFFTNCKKNTTNNFVEDKNKFFIFPDSLNFSNDVYKIIEKYVSRDVGTENVFYTLILENYNYLTKIYLCPMRNYKAFNQLATPISYFKIKNKLIIVCASRKNLFKVNNYFKMKLKKEIDKISAMKGSPNKNYYKSWMIRIDDSIKIDSTVKRVSTYIPK